MRNVEDKDPQKTDILRYTDEYRTRMRRHSLESRGYRAVDVKYRPHEGGDT